MQCFDIDDKKLFVTSQLFFIISLDICYVHDAKVGHIPIRILVRQKFLITVQLFGPQLFEK